MNLKLLEIFIFLTGLVIILFIIRNHFINVRLPKYIVADSSLFNMLGVTYLISLFQILFNLLTSGKKIYSSWINNSSYTIVQGPLYRYNEIYKRVFMRLLRKCVNQKVNVVNYRMYFIGFLFYNVILLKFEYKLWY